jgi:cytochrome c553
MRSLGVKIAVLIACTLAGGAAARAEIAAVRNCTWCHGGATQGYVPAPRLAGQRPQYLANQLASFIRHTRDGPFAKLYMWGAAKSLSPQTVHDLATYFASLPPRAANDGEPRLVPLGETIYQQGMPEANVVACVVCHGPNAEGVGEIPRLGGLASGYLKSRLRQWAQGYSAATAPPMPHIAGTLSPEQIEALASYLSFIK